MDTTAIRVETARIAGIKQDTSQIETLVQQIGLLRLQLRAEAEVDGKTQHFQRFLDQSKSYAKSVADAINEEDKRVSISATFAESRSAMDDMEAPTIESTISCGYQNEEFSKVLRPP